jgi:hypothetical protein
MSAAWMKQMEIHGYEEGWLLIRDDKEILAAREGFVSAGISLG